MEDSENIRVVTQFEACGKAGARLHLPAARGDQADVWTRFSSSVKYLLVAARKMCSVAAFLCHF